MNVDIYSMNIFYHKLTLGAPPSLCLYHVVSTSTASVRALLTASQKSQENLSQSLLRQLSGLYPVKSPWVGRTSGKV